MKKIILLTLFLLISSCLGTKRTLEAEHIVSEKEKTVIVSDSTKKEVISGAIKDEYTISLATSDSLVNTRIREALRNFASGKQSGSNSTRIYFDEDAMALKIFNMIAETKDTETTASNQIVIEKTKEELISEYAETIKKIIPWWIYVIGIALLIPHLVKIIEMLNPVFGVVRKIFRK